MTHDLAKEIARLEGELARIQRELEALKRAAGVPSTRRTQAFPAPSLQPPSLRVPSQPPSHKDAPTGEMPAVNAPESTPAPATSRSSEVMPRSGVSRSDRRVGAVRTGLSEPPPASMPTPSRRAATGDPAAGRYEFVGEGSSRKRR